MFSRVRKRGRPPKTNCVEKSRHLNYNPFKRQKYTSENKDDLSSSHLFGSYSRSSSPAYNDNIKKNKSKSKQKIKSQYFKERNSLRNYYLEYNDDRESEYHYGSDFGEEASDKSDFNDISESDIDDSLVRDDVSDSDYSVSSYSTTSGTIRKSYSNARNPTPEPLWLQNRDIPTLELPKSSDDLLVTKEHVMQALSIYEVLRHFRTLVRLSPFRFEDFCTVLVNEEHTYMLSEIHMMLLKAILREEDLQQTHFGALDQKDSVNSVLYFIDAFTWPEVLRSYVESDKTFDTNILQILNSCEYPFTNIENRLTILRFLTDLFLTTTPVREDLVHEGGFQYEDYCRVCHKVGDLLCCETCPAVFHLECVDPPLVDVPQGDWQCNLCKVHKLTGVTDCIPDIEKSGLLSRQEPLGVDRHGRKYWFLSRRIFVESEDGECWYYSTPTQLEELKELLDQNEFEVALCNELNEYYDEIVRQMSITEKLTNQAKGSKKSYFDMEDGIIQKSRQERKGKQPEDEGKSGAIEQKENSMDNDSANPRLNDEAPDIEELIECDDNRESDGSEDCQESNEDGKRKKRPGNRDIITRSKTGSLAPRSFNIEDVERDIDDAINISETNGNRMTRLKAHQISTGTFLFKLGMDGSFKNYTNQYTSNPIALNKAQKNEERDKKRHMSYKFSVTPASEFKWPGAVYGTKNQFISTLRQALLQLENSILTPFMHVNWNQMRKAWTSAVSSSTTPRDFARTSIALQACIKPVVYASVWHDQLGHVTLSRISALEREDKKRIEKKEKKEREEEEERNRLTYNFVKYSLGLKHQVYKQKGEEYRVHGQWGWLWLSVVRKYRSIDFRKLGLLAGPDKYLVHVQDDNGEKVLTVDKLNYQLLIKKSEQEEVDENEKDHAEQMIVVSDNDNASLMDISNVKVLRPITKFDEINVSKSLLSPDRLHYPKVAKKSKLNDLLARRLHLKSVEERINANKKKLLDASQMISFESSKTDDEGNERSAENKDELYHLGLQIHQLKIRYTDLTQLNKMYTCYSLRCLDEKSSNCYSPLCLKLRYLRNSLLQLLHKANALSKGGKIIFFDPSNSATSADKKEACHGVTKDTDECEGNKLLNGVIKEENERIAAIKKEESEIEVDEKPKNIDDYSGAVENAENETLSDIKIKLEEDSVESSLKQNLKNSAATTVETTVAVEGATVKAEEQMNTNDNVEKQQSNSKSETSKLPNFTLLADTSDVCNEVVIGTSEDETKCNDDQEEVVKEEEREEEEGEKENTEKKRLLPIKENKENTPPVVETTGNTVPPFGVNKPSSVTSSSSVDSKSANRKGNAGRSAYYAKRLSYKYPIDKLDFSFGGRSAKTSAISVNTKIPLKSEPPFVASEPDPCMYSTSDTRQRVILKKITNVLDNNKRKKRLQVKYPQSSTFSTRSKKISLLVLPQHELTKLARSAGRHYVSGFSYSAKPNYSVWHYPCPRPLFKTCWLYRTVNYRTISAAGLHLRIVWACLRWDDLQVKPSSYDCKNTYTTDTEIITKEILDKRHTGRFSDRTEYLIRKTVLPLEQQKTIREVTPFRSGLRKRKREEALQKMEPQISEVWVDESKLELWEIRYFSEKLEKEALTGQVQSSLRPRPLTSAVNNRFESSYLTKDDSKDKSSESSTNSTTGNRSSRYNALNKRLSSTSSDNQQSPIIKSILQTSNSNEKKILINSSPMAQQVLKLFSKPAGQIITENGKVQLMKKIQISNTTNSNLKSTLTSLLGGVISSNGTSSSTTGAVVSGTNVRLPTGRKIIMAKGPDGRTRVVAAPAILPKNAQLIATKGPLPTSETNLSNNGPKLQQRIQLSKMSDGTYHVKGLLPGQQLLTYPDGKMQVLNTRQQTAPSVNIITSKSNENNNSAHLAVVKSDSSDSSTAVTADIVGAVSSANIANLRQIVPVNKLQSNPQGVVLNQQIGITSLQNSLALPTVINNAQVLQAQPVVVNGTTNNQTVVFQQQTSGSTVLHNILSGQNQQTQPTIVQSQKPSLILTSDGQLQVVSPNQIMNTQISPSPQSLVVNSSSVGSNQIVQQLISGKATLATVDGQQLIFRTIAPNSSDASSSTASTITSTNDSILLKSVNSSNLTQNALSSPNLTQITSKTVLAPASAVTNQQPILPPQRVVSNSQNSAKSQNGLNQISGNSVSSSVNTSNASSNSSSAVINPLNGLTLEQEKEMLEKEPPGTVIKCITAQVLQSPQGPKIVLQGLHESDFSPQQLVHIRAQVKQQLLKVQADGGSEVVLGGTKIYLAVQPQDKTQSSNKETKSAHKTRMSSSRENRRQKSSRVSTSTTPVTSTLSTPVLTSSSSITTPATTTVTSTSVVKTDNVTSSTSNDLLSSLASNTVRNSIREEEIVSEIDQKLAAFSNYTSEIESKQDAVIKPDDSFSPKLSLSDTLTLNSRTVSSPPTKISGKRKSKENTAEEIIAKKPKQIENAKEPETNKPDVTLKSNCVNNAESDDDKSLKELSNSSSECSLLKGFDDDDVRQSLYPLQLMDPLKKMQSKMSTELSNSYLPNRTISTKDKLQSYQAYQSNHFSSINRKSSDSKQAVAKTPSSKSSNAPTTSTAASTPTKSSHTPKSVSSSRSAKLNSTVATSVTSVTTTKSTNSNSTPANPHLTRGKRKSYSMMLSPTRNNTKPTTSSTTTVTSTSSSGRKGRRRANLSKYNSDDDEAPSPAVTARFKKEKLLCICRTPYDDTKFYVGCDLCNNWFHGECVGITEEMSKHLSEYVCTECNRARETQELYCLCRQPYDESQFYICCDRCQDWFHGRCVGILQSEADYIDEYICPNCQRNTDVNLANMKSLTARDFEDLHKLLKQIQMHKNAWPFMKPVDPVEAPDYYQVVKEPMDLSKIECRIKERKYARLSDFIGDMTKIFDNCRYYNAKDSQFFKCAESLESYFVSKVKYLRDKLNDST